MKQLTKHIAKHQKFVYHNYFIEENGFSYHFSLGEDDFEFRPKWRCSPPVSMRDDSVLRELVFNLGMAELVSYWKCDCPPVAEVRCGHLDDWQIEWWKKLYRNGLGEFFYVNNIIPDDDIMTISVGNTDCVHKSDKRVRELSGCLIPVGGGKDSIVTMELLRERMGSNMCYIINNLQRAYDSARTAGYPDSRIIKVSRTIDPTLLALNKAGYLNGHTPFSAIVAFSSLIFAYLSGKKYIVLSNESSANEGNCEQSRVNHQYSKSTEFERDFREYADRLTHGLPEYFSLLRPFNELQITRKFVQYPEYFPVFQSCNVGTKTNTWCRKCAKCLYVYAMLAAFIDDNVLNDIFGNNLLNNSDLSDLLTALANPAYDKPFECVGTREEVNAALFMAAQRRKPNLPLLLRDYADLTGQSADGLMDYFDNTNFVPKEFSAVVKNF